MKIKVYREDILFSKYIRTRDDWKCVRCQTQYHPGSQGLHCSHFWSRKNWNTRHDVQNCDALCWPCHRLWGGDYRNEYEQFKQKQLGRRGYNALMRRAHTFAKKDRKLVLIQVKELLRLQEKI